MRLSPLVLKELRSPEQAPDDRLLVLGVTVFLTLGLVVAWLVPHPVLFQVRHAPLAVASAFVLVQLGLAAHRARLVMDERDGRTYDTLILSGAAGGAFVRGMIEAAVLRALSPLVQLAPAFAAGVVAVGAPVGPILSFLAIAAAQSVLVAALAVQAAGEAGSGARAGRGAADSPVSARVPHRALLMPLLSSLLLLPVWFAAARGIALDPAPLPAGPLLVLLAFCPAAAFVVPSIPVLGYALPFVPVAVLLNLGAAAIPIARAAAAHRHHRHDRSTARRALTAGAFVLLFGLLAASAWPARGVAALVMIAAAHLAALLAIAPDATAPAWPASAPGEQPGQRRFADLFRERCGTGIAFVLLLDLTVAPLYVLLAPAGAGREAAMLAGYAAVVSIAWAALAFKLPLPERPARGGPGLRAAVIALACASVAAMLWDEPVAARQPAWLVGPVRAVLGTAVLTSPVTGLLGVTSSLVALPSLRRGSFLGPAQLCGTSIEGLYWLSLGWYALLALVGLAMAGRRIRASRGAALRPPPTACAEPPPEPSGGRPPMTP